MKFKIGQTVWHERFGEGVVKFYDKSDKTYAVEFRHEGPGGLHSCGGYCQPRRGLWLEEHELSVMNQSPKDLRAQAAELIAKAEALEAATEQWQPVVGEVYAFWDDDGDLGGETVHGNVLVHVAMNRNFPFQAAGGYYWKHIAAIDDKDDLKNPPEWFKQRDGRWK